MSLIITRKADKKSSLFKTEELKKTTETKITKNFQDSENLHRNSSDLDSRGGTRLKKYSFKSFQPDHINYALHRPQVLLAQLHTNKIFKEGFGKSKSYQQKDPKYQLSYHYSYKSYRKNPIKI